VDRPLTIDELVAEARATLPARCRPDELAGVVDRGGLVVDVRTSDQRARDGELPGAVVIDRTVLEWRLDPSSDARLPFVDGALRRREIVLVCNEGYSSSLAAANLQRLGLAGATDLDGGFQALRSFWRQ